MEGGGRVQLIFAVASILITRCPRNARVLLPFNLLSIIIFPEKKGENNLAYLAWIVTKTGERLLEERNLLLANFS